VEVEERNQLISLYGNAASLLSEAVAGLPSEMWQYKPSPAQWSVHEIIIHITDSEVNSYIRCRSFIADPGKTIMAYDQDKWAIKLRYHDQSTTDAMELFRGLRKASFELIRNLSREIWSHTITHPEQGVITMDDWLRIYADHIPLHIRQMKRVFESWKGNKP